MTLPELLLVFTASAMASVHCAAMCGGFAVSVTRPGRAGVSAARTAVYHAGKLFTYVFVGAVAGVAGAALLNHPLLHAAQLAFGALAGAVIVVVGLQTLGLVPGQSLVNRLAARFWLGPFLGPIVKAFREMDSLGGAFLLGVFNGFLPCGLVYAFAVAAAGTGSLGGALATMLAFGAGTVPMLLAVAAGGTALARWSRLRPTLTRASAVLVMALGVITVLRGTSLLPIFASGPAHAGHSHPAPAARSASEAGGMDLEPAPAPSFTLTDQDGRTVSLHDYHGRVVVLNFIYTTCTTTCPLLTATFVAVQNGLGPDLGREVSLVSISVDPETDTPQVLRAFGEHWGANFEGWAFLTGSAKGVEFVTSEYAVHVDRTPDGLAHTETIVLIDRHGQLRSVFGHRVDPQALLGAIRRLSQDG